MQESTLIEVPICQLVPSKRNARKSKSTKEADQELLAGIRSEGLLQNLVVIQNGEPGVFEVVAGKRRLKALQQLVKEGHYPETSPIPCRFFADAANAEEISLIENTQRLRMHPADEFEIIRKMHRKNMSVEDIAANLGIPVTTVRKRLKLAQVAPAIIKAYRNDELYLEDVMAFTIEDDQLRQLEVYTTLKAEDRLVPHLIRRALRGETESSASRLGAFVGEKAYVKAGGPVSHDLFKEVVYFNDRELLVDLAIAKLKRAASKLSEHWNWTEITIDTPEYFLMERIEGHASDETNAIQAKIDAITEELEQLENEDDEWTDAQRDRFDVLERELTDAEDAAERSLKYNPEEMALAGCIVTIGDDDKVEVIEGLVRKSEEKALREKALRELLSPQTTDTSSTTPGTNKLLGNEEGASGMSQALTDDLTTYRLNIAKRFLAIGGELEARDLLYYTLCMQTFNTHYWGAPLDLNIRETRPEHSLTKPDTGRALVELAEARSELPLDWLPIEDPAERFQAFTELDHTAKITLMAYCVATSLAGSLAHTNSHPEIEVALKSLDIPWHKYFKPTVDNYLGRISKDELLNLGEQFFTDWRAEGAEKRSKKQLAEDIEGILAGEDTTMPADKRAEAIDWIPPGFAPLK